MRQIEQLLIVRVGVNRGHRTHHDAKIILNHLRHRRQAIRGARSIGDHMMLRRVIRLVVHAQHDREIRIGGRSGDNHLLHRPADVLASLRAGSEKTGGLDHDIRAHRSPVESGRIFHAKHFETLAVHGDRVVRMRHFIRKIAEYGIVLQEVRERFRVGNIVHRYDLDRRIAQRRTKDIAADASETVDSHFHWHSSSGSLFDANRRYNRQAFLRRGMLGREAENVNAAQSYCFTFTTRSPAKVTNTVFAGGVPYIQSSVCSPPGLVSRTLWSGRPKDARTISWSIPSSAV